MVRTQYVLLFVGAALASATVPLLVAGCTQCDEFLECTTKPGLRYVACGDKQHEFNDGTTPPSPPGTGTPEPGGLSTAQVLTLLEALSPVPFVGMDCVEVAPPFDHAQLTSYAAAIFVWTYLCGQIARA